MPLVGIARPDMFKFTARKIQRITIHVRNAKNLLTQTNKPSLKDCKNRRSARIVLLVHTLGRDFPTLISRNSQSLQYLQLNSIPLV